MSAPVPQEPSSNNALIWVLVGCAGLLVLGLCAATGFGVWLYIEDTTRPVAHPSYPPPVAPLPPPGTGPGPALPAPPAMDASPRMVSATVTSVTGSSPVQVGAICGFAVEKHARPEPPGYWCRAQMVCGGLLLYGGPNSGYFPCEAFEQPRRDVVGQDDQTTQADTDGAMRLDTRAGTLTIRDDIAGPYGTYSVEARVTDVR